MHYNSTCKDRRNSGNHMILLLRKSHAGCKYSNSERQVYNLKFVLLAEYVLNSRYTLLIFRISLAIVLQNGTQQAVPP